MLSNSNGVGINTDTQCISSTHAQEFNYNTT